MIKNKANAKKGTTVTAPQMLLEALDLSKYTDEDFDNMNSNFLSAFSIGFTSFGIKNMSNSIILKATEKANVNSIGKGFIYV